MSLVDLTNLDISGNTDNHAMWSVIVGDYRYVLYSTGKALVFKGENKEPSYEISPIGCTCPGDRYSSNPCKHRKAVSFLGDGSAVPPIEGTAVRTKEISLEDATFDVDDLLG